MRLGPFFISMPVKVAKRGNEFCVVEPNGTPVNGGCHSTREEAVKHAAAINANAKSRLLLFKDHNGLWNWLGIVSNNRMDREADILTSDSHRKFVDSIDSGRYREVFDKDAPDLWVWHVPVPIGYAETVAYDERGFLIAAGKGYEGEFYDDVFSGLDNYERENPGGIGMSHGMPWDFLEIEQKDDNAPDAPQLITGYMSEEFTFLPIDHAANLGTGMGGIMVKSMPLEIEEYKRDWFVDTFGDDVVMQFDARLSEIGKAADEADVPKKEITMTDSTDKKKESDSVAEDTLAEEEVEDTAVEEEATPEDVEDKQEDEDEEEDEEKQEDEEEEEEEEKQYVTTSDLEEVVQEVIKGVTEPFAEVTASLAKMREQIDDIQKELDTLKMTEDERVTEKAKETPAASLSAIIARTIVGQEQAQVDYNKERKFHQAGPEETEFDSTNVAGLTGIASIDETIMKQRGRNRVQMATQNGQ
jgi:hypothetical protein